jgi:predicted Zn-ribbon and HTH transcriptional regulator
MVLTTLKLKGYRCTRCGHEWVPRKNRATEPRVCPRCKSPYWNRPRKLKKSKNA